MRDLTGFPRHTFLKLPPDRLAALFTRWSIPPDLDAALVLMDYAVSQPTTPRPRRPL